jgi:hypothetical protein
MPVPMAPAPTMPIVESLAGAFTMAHEPESRFGMVIGR